MARPRGTSSVSGGNENFRDTDRSRQTSHQGCHDRVQTHRKLASSTVSLNSARFELIHPL